MIDKNLLTCSLIDEWMFLNIILPAKCFLIIHVKWEIIIDGKKGFGKFFIKHQAYRSARTRD